MLTKIGHDNLYGSVTLTWSVDNPANFNGIKVYLQGEELSLLGTLSVYDTEYIYVVPSSDRGIKLNFVVALFVIEDVEFIEYEIATIPNAPTGLVLSPRKNEVELHWSFLEGQNIKGFVIKRDGNEIGIAASTKYTDIGNFYSPPSSGGTYNYEVSTITFDDVVSTSISLFVALPHFDNLIRERLSQQVAISNEGQFRICSQDEDGSRSRWTTYRKIEFEAPYQPHEKQYRIRAITTDGAQSHALVTKSLVVDNDFGAAGAYPTFRLRIRDVDGLESDAIVTVAQDYVWKQKVLINKSDDVLINKTDKTLTGREL